MTNPFLSSGKHYASRTHAAMKDVLMNPKEVGPEIHYYMIRGGVDQKNVTVLECGTIKGEYIKTYGHYHIGELDETYWIVYGEGCVILQKPAIAENGSIVPDVIEEFQIIPVTGGSEVYIPKAYGHALVNTGNTYFVSVDNSPVDFTEKNPTSMPGHAEYETIKSMHGLAYYVIEHEGKPALIKNLLYKQIKQTVTNGIPVIT
jgi:glucose-6-phosphate isomerase, archaeal